MEKNEIKDEGRVISESEIAASRKIDGFTFGKIREPIKATEILMLDKSDDAPTPEDIQETMRQLAETAVDPEMANACLNHGHTINLNDFPAINASELTSDDILTQGESQGNSDTQEPPEGSNKIENRPLDSYKVRGIIGALKLEPLIVFVDIGTEEKDESVGIPGFYDSKNNRFMLLTGGPVTAEGFDEKFGEFIDMKKAEIGARRVE